MRILCLSYEYPPIGGGGSPVCAGVAESLVAAGHEVDVVTSAMTGLRRAEHVAGVHVHRVPCLRRRRHMAGTLELATTLRPMYRHAMRLARRHAYDLIHCHFIVPTGIVGRWVSRVTGLPCVITAHGSDVPGYNPDRFHLAHRVMRPIWRRVVRDAAAITSPSRFLASLIAEQADVTPHVVPNGMTIPPRSDARRVDRVLMVSRLFERKGVQDVLAALEDCDPRWQVEIAGDGPYRATLERLARRHGVNARFLGFVARRELGELYRTSKIFVFPSRRENFPVVLLEAMAGGCAVVAADAPGSSEVVGDAALAVEPGNVGMMRRTLGGLMADEQQVARLRERAYRRVRRFAWDRIARDYEAVFERCMASAAATGADAPGQAPSTDEVLATQGHDA
ncbi:MAG: glycosyltransferase family 4 protein [Phycisphaeraceae bacterium]